MLLRFIFVVTIQFAVAMDMRSMMNMGKRGIDQLQDYLHDFCPNVQLAPEFKKYADCVENIEKPIENISPDASIHQLCSNLGRYMLCNRPWIDTMKRCNHIKANDVISVVEAVIGALHFTCENGGLADFFKEDADLCLTPNLMQCYHSILQPTLESYLSDDHSTYFSSDNCRILRIVVNCTIELSTTCTSHKSVSLFRNASDLLLSNTCGRAAILLTPAQPTLTTTKGNIAVSSTFAPVVSNGSAPSLMTLWPLALIINILLKL